MRVCLVDRGEVSGATTGLGEGNVLCCDKRPGAELELARLGLEAYDEIEELLGAEAGIRRKGALVVHTGADSWEEEPERVDELRTAGIECSLVDASQVREAEPELSGELLGAALFPRDLQCDPRAIARGLAREAEALGAAVETGWPVESVTVRGGRVEGIAAAGARIAADAVVIAAGAWSAPLARGAGLELPVEPRKGQLVRLERRPGFLRHKVIDGSYMAAVESERAELLVSTVVETTLDGHVLVGSSRERRGFDLSVDPAVSEALLESAARIAPRIRRAARGRRLGRPAPVAAGRPAGDRAIGRRRRPLDRHRSRGRGRGARSDHGPADRAGAHGGEAGPRPRSLRPGPVLGGRGHDLLALQR